MNITIPIELVNFIFIISAFIVLTRLYVTILQLRVTRQRQAYEELRERNIGRLEDRIILKMFDDQDDED